MLLPASFQYRIVYATHLTNQDMHAFRFYQKVIRGRIGDCCTQRPVPDPFHDEDNLLGSECGLYSHRLSIRLPLSVVSAEVSHTIYSSPVQTADAGEVEFELSGVHRPQHCQNVTL